MSPVSPLHNIYFQQLQPLIDLKLRLGRALTKQITLSERGSNVIPAEWQAPVRELELGLELARTTACQRRPVEAQLLFTLGKSVAVNQNYLTLLNDRFSKNPFYCVLV